MKGLRPALNKNWSCVDRCPRNGGYINVYVYAIGGILRAQELSVLREKQKQNPVLDNTVNSKQFSKSKMVNKKHARLNIYISLKLQPTELSQ